MADNFSSSSNQTSIRRKKRSASICAPGSSSMEQILVPFSKDVHKKDNDSITPESITPTRKRRPATRSQSARVSGANKSVRKKNLPMNPVMTQNNHGNSGGFKHYKSEPKLSDQQPSPRLRRQDARRGHSVYHSNHQKKNNSSYLQVPGKASNPVKINTVDENEFFRLRSFSISSKGFENRGDSFRRKDHSHCVIDQHENENISIVNNNHSDIQKFNIVVLGDEQVGKSSLISRFMESESPGDHRAVEERHALPVDRTVSMIVDEEESQLRFIENHCIKNLENLPELHGFLVLFSVNDKKSHMHAISLLQTVIKFNVNSKAVILVGTKSDLARSRVLCYDDCKFSAYINNVKYCEVSAIINEKVDYLLVGTLTQIMLRIALVNKLGHQIGNLQLGEPGASNTNSKETKRHPWYKSKSLMKAGAHAKYIFGIIVRKEDKRYKNCDNLFVL